MSEKHLHERAAELLIPPLRFASVGMTKGRVALSFVAVAGTMDIRQTKEPQVNAGTSHPPTASRTR